MNGQKFAPGFRLSARDVIVLIGGGVAASGIAVVDGWIGAAVAFVVLHFFLFCNVLRMSRGLELIWAAVFSGDAIGAAIGVVSWPLAFGAAGVVTLVLAVIEMRRASYHGVGWRNVNPGLPVWWAANRGAATL